MGTIYRNGVPFVGSGGAGGVEMTQAEYDDLPTSEKMNGAIYFITDGDVSYPSASQMRYDNTESQIPATTVQGAIDENRIEINDLKAGLLNEEQSPSTISCASATLQPLATLSIPETGVYILWGYHEWTAAFSQAYQDAWNVSGSTFTKRSMTGVNGGGSEFVVIANIDAGSSVTYQTYQTSGATQTASRIRVRYVKIASS